MRAAVLACVMAGAMGAAQEKDKVYDVKLVDVCWLYDSNPVESTDKGNGKLGQFTHEIHSIADGKDKASVVVFYARELDSVKIRWVHCHFTAAQRKEVYGLQKGQQVTIVARCRGIDPKDATVILFDECKIKPR